MNRNQLAVEDVVLESKSKIDVELVVEYRDD